MEIIQQKSFNRQSLRNALKEFIYDSRKNIENKTNIVNKILKSMKEENENLITKSIYIYYNIN